MTNLRRSMVSGGILNPPDRPRKISAKYHGIETDVKEWFSGVSLYDKCRCAPNFINQFILLRARLRRTNSFYKLSDITDNTIGNPSLMIKLFGINITDASVRYWYYMNRIKSLVGEANIVLEIGSGYGGLAERLAVSLNSKKYLLVDLPETLSVAASYLKQRNLRFMKLYPLQT